MSLSKPKIWSLIKRIEFDDLSSNYMFSCRLARENGWKIYFARRAIEEYKKFLYLTQISSSPITPSFQVDQVWHQHLTYSRHYWGVCMKILSKPLHHGPTKGGGQEASRYYKQYIQTLEIYEEEFDVYPPNDIWPSPEVRFGRDTHFQWVNVKENWVIPKIKLDSFFKFKTKAKNDSF